jgi:hypothetical protein
LRRPSRFSIKAEQSSSIVVDPKSPGGVNSLAGRNCSRQMHRSDETPSIDLVLVSANLLRFAPHRNRHEIMGNHACTWAARQCSEKTLKCTDRVVAKGCVA